MQVLEIVPGQSQMPQVTSRQGSSQMRLHSEKPQADNHIVSLMPDVVPDSSPWEIKTPVQPVSISLVLTMGPGNTPADRVLTTCSVQFGSKQGHKTRTTHVFAGCFPDRT